MNLSQSVRIALSAAIVVTASITSLPADTAETPLPIIPQPQTVKLLQGTVTLDAKTTIVYATGAEKAEASTLAETLRQATGLPLPLIPMPEMAGKLGNVIILTLDETLESTLGKEGYRLAAHPTPVIGIAAASPTGLFYGGQTLRQLLPATAQTPPVIPCCKIEDKPRFGWRGYMLDVSRHFAEVAEIKTILNEMSIYKLNRFHWHLTDDEGWRIEIRKYPKLTTVGGIGDKSNPKAAAKFYTQEQIKDIVAYAQARHIIIIPEIDMPGHASGAVRAYPEYAGGGCERLPDFTFNPGREETYKFLEDILREVTELFPSAKVVHYGGDEVHFGWGKWQGLPDVKTLMAKEKLADNTAIEKYFNRRMAAFINSLGWDTAGWDEIVDAGLPVDHTIVYWWRHDKPAQLQKALAAGYRVVLCPRLPCYFDFLQNESHKIGRRWKGINELPRVYAFPDESTLKPADNATTMASPRILGMQAALWSETTATPERRQFLTFPRLIALAEAAWTPANRKDFKSFEARLKEQLPQFKQRGITFYDPFANSPEVVDPAGGASSKPTKYIDQPGAKQP